MSTDEFRALIERHGYVVKEEYGIDYLKIHQNKVWDVVVKTGGSREKQQWWARARCCSPMRTKASPGGSQNKPISGATTGSR